jgi:hypothetical protein
MLPLEIGPDRTQAGVSRRSGRTLVSVLIAILCVLLACVAAMGPARHLGATADEGAHIGPGLQWWIEHRFAYEPLTPPLARVVVSFLPWLWGFHSQGMQDAWSEGRAVLATSGNPALLLLLARIGTLLFLVWSSAVVWLLGRRAGVPAVRPPRRLPSPALFRCPRLSAKPASRRRIWLRRRPSRR